jgi:hypothetical protein
MIGFLKILDALADTLKLQKLDECVHFVDKLLSLAQETRAAHDTVEQQKKDSSLTPKA